MEPHYFNVDLSCDKERAERILQKAEKACLITNSIKSETRMISKILINQEMVI